MELDVAIAIKMDPTAKKNIGQEDRLFPANVFS